MLARTARLSVPVLQEYYVNVTQKLRPGLPKEMARQDVRNLLAWQPVNTDALLLESAWGLTDPYGFSWWDAQIVAAARRAECTVLLSEDMQHGLNIDGLCILNPFLHPEVARYSEGVQRTRMAAVTSDTSRSGLLHPGLRDTRA